MPYEFHVDHGADLVLVRFTGDFTMSELLEVVTRLATDDAFRSLSRRIYDTRGASGAMEVSQIRAAGAELVEALGARVLEGLASNRVAVLAPTDAVFGSSRQLQVLTQPREGTSPPPDTDNTQRVVRTFDEAALWVGLPSGHPDPFPDPGSEKT
jgi:hypothetical protein